jgi:hypothetical protein
MVNGHTDTDTDTGNPEPPVMGDEAATLLGFLDRQRATFAWKVGGLDERGLRARLGPSSMTLGGMLKHLARFEDDMSTEWLHGSAQRAAGQSPVHPEIELPSLRYILLNMIEEYARHNGHADLILNRWTALSVRIHRVEARCYLRTACGRSQLSQSAQYLAPLSSRAS